MEKIKEKLKELYRKYPWQTIVGGIILFVLILWLIFRFVLARQPAAARDAALPVMPTLPGAGIGIPVPAIEPLRAEDVIRQPTREQIIERVPVIERIIERVQEIPTAVAPAAVTPRPIEAVAVIPPRLTIPEKREIARRAEAEAVVRGILPPRPAALPTPTPRPAAVPTPIPARVIDHALVRRLQDDIARLTRRIGDPEAEAYFRRQWGSMQQYIAAQRQRLAAAMRGS